MIVMLEKRCLTMLAHPRITEVELMTRKFPKCGEPVVDIIYGTGDMTEIEFVMEYGRESIMGSDNILRCPPYLGMCFGLLSFS